MGTGRLSWDWGRQGGPWGAGTPSSRVIVTTEVPQPAGKGHPQQPAAPSHGHGAASFARKAAACFVPGYFPLRALGP